MLPGLLGIGIVSWFSVFSGNSGVLGADIGLLFPLLRSCYFTSSVRLLDLRPCGLYLRDGAGMGTRDAGENGRSRLVRALISRPTLFPIASTWYSPLAPVTFCLPRVPDFHLPSGSPQEPQTRRLSHGRFREPCSREVLPSFHLPNRSSFLPGALAPPPLFACV